MIKRLFLSLGVLIISAQYAYSLDVVYPKKYNVIINSPSSFFIGSADSTKKLTINGVDVPVHSSGGFAYPVALNFGENTFTLESGREVLVYKINRPKSKIASAVKSGFIPYKENKNLKVMNDFVPLRSTPVDGGINRLAHLKKDIPLVADGEDNNFYRVKLGAKEFGWVLKSNAVANDSVVESAKILGADISSDEDFYVYTVHLTGMVPWTIEENSEKLKVTLYNISNFSNGSYNMILPVKELMDNRNLLGYNVGFQGNDFVVRVRKPLKFSNVSSLDNIKIAIDAGHGGSEIGAVGCLGNFEKDINLQYAKDLAEILKSKGADVFLIRDKDVNVSLTERVSKTNNENASVFISIHGNALPDSGNPLKNRGAEIYYYFPQARPLADSIMDAMSNQAGIINHGIFQQSFAVVRNSNALSVLIELGYLINPEDNALILNDQFRKKSVNAIADGLENYFKTQR